MEWRANLKSLNKSNIKGIMMIKFFVIVFALILNYKLFAMNYCILIRNNTDQPFKIILMNIENHKKTLFSKTSISNIWYGEKEINNGEEISAHSQKRLFIKLDELEHKVSSDFFVLQNHNGDFYVNFGKISGDSGVSLPVVTDKLICDVPSRYINLDKNEIISMSRIYKAKHTSSREEGAEVITIIENL